LGGGEDGVAGLCVTGFLDLGGGGACVFETGWRCGLCPFWKSFDCLASGLLRDGDGEFVVLVDLLRLSVSWMVNPPWVRKSSSGVGVVWPVRAAA